MNTDNIQIEDSSFRDNQGNIVYFNNRILRANDSLIFGIIKDSKNKNLSFEFNNSEALNTNLSSKISSWKDRNKQLYEATEIEKKITFFTLSLIILVASFNLSSSIMQITSKKLKDLAILMSLGMNKTGIKIIFIIYSYLIGAGAIFLGIFLVFTFVNLFQNDEDISLFFVSLSLFIIPLLRGQYAIG